MNKVRSGVFIVLFILFLSGWNSISDEWIVEKHKAYTLFYSDADRSYKAKYTRLIDNGIKSVKAFFGDGYKSKFQVYIYPNRDALDKQWQKDWHTPGLKSECWMVASGVAGRLDALSPRVWDTEACEHHYSDKIKTQQLFTHELVHVYHGQLNASPDFSDVDRIDWFVEGLATYASGQCDAGRMAEIKEALSNHTIPESLDNFWTGKLKYGLAGSMVMFIDHQYGRPKLKELLKFNRKEDILASLKVTEAELLIGWKSYIETFQQPK